MTASGFFVTGKNAAIRVNGATIDYATNISYSVQVKHFGARLLGQYENSSIEPLSYDVSGSFSIIRYVEGAVQNSKERGLNLPPRTDNAGNGIGSFSASGGQNLSSAAGISSSLFGSPDDNKANEALDPSRLQNAIGFDIELYQKVPGVGLSGVTRLRGCRIINCTSEMQSKGLLIQTFSFMAAYVDEDSFLANASFNADGT